MTNGTMTVSDREAVVLRAVGEVEGGTEDDVWNAARRIAAKVPWPSPNGLPLSLHPYLRRLTAQGLLDRQEQPWPVGNYRAPAIVYVLTEQGRATLHAIPAPANEAPAPAPAARWFRLRDGVSGPHERVLIARAFGGVVQYQPEGQRRRLTVPADEFERRYEPDGEGR